MDKGSGGGSGRIYLLIAKLSHKIFPRQDMDISTSEMYRGHLHRALFMKGAVLHWV